MNLMISTFILVIAAVVSIFISRVIPQISVNYLSLLVGMVLFCVPILGNHIEKFNSEIFIGLIVAPLLFFEGQATRLNVVGQEFKHIIQTTVVLVILAMIVAGFSLAALGVVSLPLAFILAAISTPTDATAMESVTNGLEMPTTEGTFLKMESLFNDASGIILLNMAVLWYANGYINYGQTMMDFMISAGGGVLFGFVSAWILVLSRQVWLRSSYNALNASLLIYIITPFILYYAAEALHVSGIIAVVVAGLVHNAEAQRSRLLNSQQVHFAFDLVSMITEIFNSMVFVVLGFMFIQILVNDHFGHGSLNFLMIGVVLYVSTVLVRYVYGRLRLNFKNRPAWIFSLGGVHGAVTLALAYTLADTAVGRTDFSLVLMAASTLIILSMVVPTIIFRWLLKPAITDDEATSEIDKIRVEMVHQAIDTVQKMYLPANVKQSVIFDLMTQKQRTRTRDFTRAWFDVVRHPEFTGAEKELEMRAFMNALARERDYLDMISQREVKYQKYVFKLYNETLLAESLIIGPTIFDKDKPNE
ncbi:MULTISPECIES: cation:proton antiporter [Lactiplantibacillus]|uniref:Cation:proton antiporter n=1 Tax=Lactiplantibacillus pentosus TaxID=1589 RepID=A0AAP5PWN9_LACPE|nr:cation:proton antiporter [Lactiplantibacillus pentosus]MBU7482705.1 cation:proton antiporter [Lactiplantibacillus sp. 30.2.29]MBU7460005.1 cation:proton antiporter [Lactiplantibacillus pentosus]MBU7464251.1 cation:proton antiporter [Lactiplantibacillus pentosus]MBU7476050.1 cation:proton antiporter [Lactiplantibacillus pentosus]MBU7485898.1 cation:proton antiporter [Lactiplantibacillus pentosus]